MKSTSSRVGVRSVCGLLPVVLLLAACDEADPLAPAATGPAFDRIEVAPASAELSSVAPGNTAVLTVRALDEYSRQLSTAGGVLTFASDVPATAAVDSSGIVTAIAPGTALITVSLTLGDVTRTADATVSVFEPGAWPAIGGDYDLTARITGSDPAWGVEDGTIQVTVLSIEHVGGPQFTGTFSELGVITPGGDVSSGPPGTVGGIVQTDGRLVLELTFAGSQSSYWAGKGMVTAQGIEGTFGTGGHIVGTFTADRR